jgi:hypothetical protein
VSLQPAAWIAAPTKSIGATPTDICSLAAGMGQRPHLDREIRWHAALIAIPPLLLARANGVIE